MSAPRPQQLDGWKPAIARIDVRLGNGAEAHGTGALITERLVLTALHVVGDRHADPPAFYDEGGEVVVRFPSHQTRGRVVRDAVSFSARLDFALIECEHPPAGVRPLPLRDVTAAGVDARWSSFGFPMAAAQTGGGMVVEGNVSDARGQYQGAEALQLYSQQAAAGDGAPVPGLSGGPVIVDGAVVGVLRSSLMAEGGRNVAGTLFACPARVIAEQCAGLLPPLESYPGLPGIVAGDLPPEPYRYLTWYHEQDAALFFGRNRELADVYQRLVDPDEAPLLLLYGQSGVGKSSFLAAGLLPRLKRSHEACYVRRDRDAGLLGSIVQALGGGTGDGETLATVWRRIEKETGRPLLVIADQVEEVYSRPSEREDELGELLAAAAALFKVRATRPRGRLVLSFRKEWYAEVATHVRGAELAHGEVFLRGLDRAAIVEVVRGIADDPRLHKRYGLSLAEGLADRIADDLREDRGSPIAPTLQVLLTKMWRAATAANRTAPQFDDALYEQSRRGDLLREFLREQLAVVERAHPEAVASGLVLDLLGQHVTEADTAGQRTLAELRASYAHLGDRAEALIAELTNVYLLVDSSEDRADHADATRLAHDTMALHVRRAINASQAPGQRARRILDNRAVEWSAGATGAVLDEADLRRVELGRAGTRALTPDEERLVQASVAQRRARKRRSWTAAALAGALAVVAAGALVSTVRFWRSGLDAEKRSKAEQANTRRAETEARLRAMAALAEKEILGDQTATLRVVSAVGQSRAELGRVLPALNRALALVVQHARQVPFSGAVEPLGALPPGLSYAPAEATPAEHEPRAAVPAASSGSEAASPQAEPTANLGGRLALLGGKVVLAAWGHVIKRWELTPGGPPKELEFLNPELKDISVVVASPNGALAASGDIGGNVVIWGKDGRRIGGHRIAGEKHVTALAFSSDGDRLAIGDHQGGVHLLSVPDLQPEVVPQPGGTNRKSKSAATPGGGGYGVARAGDSLVRVNAVAVVVDPTLGPTIAAATPDTLTVWNRARTGWRKQGEGRIEATWDDRGFKLLAPLAIDDERGLVTGEHDGTVRLWGFLEPDAGRLPSRVISRPREAMGDQVTDTLHLVGGRIAVESGDRLRVFHPDSWLVEEHRVQPLGGLAYSADMRRAVYTDARSVGLIDGVGLEIGEPRRLVRWKADQGVAGEAPSLVFSRASNHGAAQLAACTGREVWTLALDRSYPNNARQAANEQENRRIGAGVVKGKEVLVQARYEPGGRQAARVQATGWGGDSKAQAISSVVEVHPSTSFDVQGAIAVRADPYGVEVFDLEGGRSIAHFGDPSSWSPTVALGHPRERLLTVLQSGFVVSRDFGGKELGIYGCPKDSGPGCEARPPSWNYTGIAQSADGNTLAAAGDDFVHVWFQATGRGARPNPDLDIGQTGDSTALAVSPDGSVIALASARGIALYDRAGQLFGELPTGGGVLALAFDPAGQLLATADKASTLRLWRVNPDDWLKVACRRLVTSLLWADAGEYAKRACASVRERPMTSDGIGPELDD